MAKITTLAAGLGVLTGLLTVGGWLSGLTAFDHSWTTLELVLAVVLVFDSLLALVGPRRILYSTALLSALLGGSEWIASEHGATAAIILTIAIAGITLVLSTVAARLETQVAEQSNPMNLPVFG